jgi:SAM-dependent methyltransferase
MTFSLKQSIMTSRNFDQNYFEDGIRSRVSGYENYRWMPERSLREASEIINKIQFDRVLDFGCAKGFLVRAMRLLGKDAHGVDISEYAIENAHPLSRDFLTKISKPAEISDGWDLIIAKDVLEHLTKDEIKHVLDVFRTKTNKLFIAVPLGEEGRLRIREYEVDKTHVTRENEEWWLEVLVAAGFKITYFDYRFGYVKDKWTEQFPYGNAFIVAE